MVTEARKLHIIEELLKLKSEAVLSEVEAVLRKAAIPIKNDKRSAHDFSGIISKKDSKLMETAIEEGCEQIHPDDWK